MPESNPPKDHDEPLDESLDESLEEEILALMRKTPNCTYGALVESIGVPRSKIQRAIKLLTNQGKIERVGGKRYGHWEIPSDGPLDEPLDEPKGEPLSPKRQSGVLDDVLADRILEILYSDPQVTQAGLAEKLSVPYRSLQRKMVELKNKGIIERVGGKRYGHWEIHE